MITGIKDVKTASISGDNMELSFNLEVNNPNGFKVVLKESDLDISINDKSLGRTFSAEKMVIKRRTTSSNPVKLSMTYRDFMAATIGGIGLLLKSEPVTFKVKGSIKGRIGWLKKNIPIETTQKIKL